jgi:ubiquinone/menaquinone biosynthesis C-methylase UbiE
MKVQNLLRKPATDPTSIYRYRDGLYAADLLTAAIVHLDFFSSLAGRPADLARICRRLRLKPRPADVMLTLFVAMGFLRRRGSRFELTGLAREHLVRSSPWFIGPYFASLKERPVCRDMLNVLRTDRPANWGSLRKEKEWSKAMGDPGFAEQFTAAMDCRGVYLGRAVAEAVDLRRRRTLLDVAGGSGIYACAIVARHRHLKATILEKPPVDRVARAAIARRGFADRVSVVTGDMFRDVWPMGFDVHLISNVLHDWDVPVVRKLLASSFRSLEPGGMVVIHDAHLNPDKSGPLHVAEYSAMLMHSTEGRCYSVSEMKEYLQEAGFGRVTFTQTAAARSVVRATKPPRAV